MEVYDLLEGESLPGWMRDWVDEERRASALRAFELSVVPGLLQTPDYARTVLDSDETAVNARLERQPFSMAKIHLHSGVYWTRRSSLAASAMRR
jgi:Domain of unknown function (DUF5753)